MSVLSLLSPKYCSNLLYSFLRYLPGPLARQRRSDSRPRHRLPGSIYNEQRRLHAFSFPAQLYTSGSSPICSARDLRCAGSN